MEQYTGFSAHASLALIAEWTNTNQVWEELRGRVHIRQKTIRHSPSDKLQDLLITIWAGGERISSINNVLRTDEGLQRLFGRTSCAEQSTVSETLNAVSAGNIVEMEGFIGQVYREHSLCYQHDYKKNWLLLDVDLTGMLAGKQAEGSEKGYFSGERNGRGRQVGRVYASQYDEIVNEQLYSGKVQLEASLLELVKMTEKVLDSDEHHRKHTIVRVDGGGGTDKNIDRLLLDGYWILMKVKNWQRTQKLVKTVTSWHNLPELPGHDAGWVGTPHEYEKDTRQLAIRWPKEKGGFHYCVLVFRLTDFDFSIDRCTHATPTLRSRFVFRHHESIQFTQWRRGDLHQEQQTRSGLEQAQQETLYGATHAPAVGAIGIQYCRLGTQSTCTAFIHHRRLWDASSNSRRFSYFWKDSF